MLECSSASPRVNGLAADLVPKEPSALTAVFSSRLERPLRSATSSVSEGFRLIEVRSRKMTGFPPQNVGGAGAQSKASGGVHRLTGGSKLKGPSGGDPEHRRDSRGSLRLARSRA